MLEKLELTTVRQIVHDRLNDNSLSVTLCAKMGKNTIKIQSYYIKNITVTL